MSYNFCNLFCSEGRIWAENNCTYSGVRLSFYTDYMSPIEIGLLRAMITYVKSCSMALAPNKYETDLSNEVLNIDFCQDSAKISKIKFGGGKKCQRDLGSAELADTFSTCNFDLWYFCSPLTEINFWYHIWKIYSYLFRARGPRPWKNLWFINHGSKQPHFNRACVVSVKTQLYTTVTTTLLIILQLIFLHSWPAVTDLTLVKLLEVKMHHPQSSGKFLYKSIILDGHITVVLQFWMKSPYCLLLIASSIQASLEFCG